MESLQQVRFTPIIKAEALRWDEASQDWVPTGKVVDAIDPIGFGLAGKCGNVKLMGDKWVIVSADCDRPSQNGDEPAAITVGLGKFAGERIVQIRHASIQRRDGIPYATVAWMKHNRKLRHSSGPTPLRVGDTDIVIEELDHPEDPPAVDPCKEREP